MRRRALVLVATCLTAPAAALGQRPPAAAPPVVSTARLGSWERPVSVELAVGRTLGGAQTGYGTPPLGAVVLASVRFSDIDGTALRMWLLYARRESNAEKTRAQFTVAGMAFDFAGTVGRNASLALSLGIGKALSIRQAAPDSGSYQGYADEEELTPLGGIAVRYRRFVSEMHFALMGGDPYLPITVGVRF